MKPTLYVVFTSVKWFFDLFFKPPTIQDFILNFQEKKISRKSGFFFLGFRVSKSLKKSGFFCFLEEMS
jgi:hypothetical protein